MPARCKLIPFIIAFWAIFLFSPKKIFARVVINEFSSYGRDDWVEIYRTSRENLSLYYLEDAAGNTKQLSWGDCVEEFCTVGWYNKLNKSGDVIKLFLAGYPLPKNQVAYGDVEGNVVATPGEGQSAGRSADGADTWVIFSTPTKGSTNNTATSMPTTSPTPSPSPSSSPTSSPSLSPTTATYKINEVKDENGNTLSSVKVHVDGVYVHHYAPETLTFCDSCQCDTYINCGFGEHTIKLEKSDYANWSETKTINLGDAHEVNPIMSPSGSTSLSTSSPAPTPTPSLKPVKILGATLSGLILGEESSPAGFFPWEATEEAGSQEATGSTKIDFLPKLFLGLGFVFLVSAGGWLCYTRLRVKIPIKK